MPRPPTDDALTLEEIETLREEMLAQREKIREALAEDLGGDPEDYDATKRPVPDGGDVD